MLVFPGFLRPIQLSSLQVCLNDSFFPLLLIRFTLSFWLLALVMFLCLNLDF